MVCKDCTEEQYPFEDRGVSLLSGTQNTRRKVDYGQISEFTRDTLWISPLYFCTGLALFDPETNRIAAGHDKPCLGDLQEGKTAASLDNLLKSAPKNALAFGVSIRDLDLLKAACDTHEVTLVGTYKGDLWWDQESGEKRAYKKDLVVKTSPSQFALEVYEDGVLQSYRTWDATITPQIR